MLTISLSSFWYNLSFSYALNEHKFLIKPCIATIKSKCALDTIKLLHHSTCIPLFEVWMYKLKPPLTSALIVSPQSLCSIYMYGCLLAYHSTYKCPPIIFFFNSEKCRFGLCYCIFFYSRYFDYSWFLLLSKD